MSGGLVWNQLIEEKYFWGLKVPGGIGEAEVFEEKAIKIWV